MIYSCPLHFTYRSMRHAQALLMDCNLGPIKLPKKMAYHFVQKKSFDNVLNNADCFEKPSVVEYNADNFQKELARISHTNPHEWLDLSIARLDYHAS